MSVSWEQTTDLDRTILVLAFEGWFDAGSAATNAVEWMRDQHEATLVATIGCEPYFNFQNARPSVRMVEGDRVIDWPETTCSVKKAENHDLALVTGIEPHLRWESFSADLIAVARGVNAELVITLGALIDNVPHTRPASVQGSSTDEGLATRLGLSRPSYQGPTGLIGVLHDALAREELPVISLRAAVPHYVSGTPNPKATMALLQRVEQVTGFSTNHGELHETATDWESRVNEIVETDEEMVGYVRRIEAELDRRASENLPSGDDLAAEFERFLRERRDED